MDGEAQARAVERECYDLAQLEREAQRSTVYTCEVVEVWPRGHKQCRTCGRWKGRRQFYRHPSTTDGREAECILCKRDYSRDAHHLKREVRLPQKRAYGKSEAGKATRQRYRANGDQALHNFNRRPNRRIAKQGANP